MRKESGFSMLEVLVSMIIIMIGVLGIAGMQLLAINNTEVARYQSLAALLASSMATEMQANVSYWGAASNNITVNGTVVTGGPGGSASCKNAVCSAPQMANYTLQSWGQALANTLPSGTGTISCTVIPAPTVCTLTLNWSEKTVESVGVLSGSSGVSYKTMVTVQ